MYLDNLKTFLTLTVVCFHSNCCMYPSAGFYDINLFTCTLNTTHTAFPVCETDSYGQSFYAKVF